MHATVGEGYGVFAGKLVFGSTGASAAVYLTTGSYDHRSKKLPVMQATSVTEQEVCLLYAASGDGGRYYLQTGSLLWVTLHTSLGWLILTEDFQAAVPIELGGSTPGQELRVVTDSGSYKVYYTVGTASPLLTINESASALDRFALEQRTASLAGLHSDGGHGADLANVNFAGADLSGIDFTGADLTGANLTDAVCTGTGFDEAILAEAVMSGLTADGASFDQADCSHAVLDGTAWGKPASARGIILTGCSAVGAVLGDPDAALRCDGAILTGGDFSNADLTGLDLTGAVLGSTTMVGTTLDGTTLDDADLSTALMRGASLVGASVQQARAHGTNLIDADLSGANLNRAKLGSRSFLFDLPATFGDQLDSYAFPQSDLVEEFRRYGVTLSSQAPVTVLVEGERWTIDDRENGPFSLVMSTTGSIAVFLSADLAPAILTGARCVGTKASSALLAGADLRGVQWYGAPATLDHADLEGACLSDSLLVETDFTQAFLSGADFSGAILVGAKLKGHVISSGDSHQLTGFARSQLQGVDFTQTTILGATLYRAGVATSDGVPLLQLPLGVEDKLTPSGLSEIAPAFTAAGYPLGTEPTIREASQWLLENSDDPNSSAPRSYRVTVQAGQLAVADGANGQFLFYLSESFITTLNSGVADARLQAVFAQNAYSLATDAPITAAGGWEIGAGSDQPMVGPTNYPTLYIQPTDTALQVYGVTMVRLRDWDAYPAGVAFQGTNELQNALAPTVIGPSGDPYSFVASGQLDWVGYLSLP